MGSLSRLPPLDRADLTPEGQASYDLVIGDGPHPLTGPRAVTLYSPKVAEAFHILNEYLRDDGVLSSQHLPVDRPRLLPER